MSSTKKSTKKPVKAARRAPTKTDRSVAAIRRKKIAAAVAAGKPEKKIAQELDMTRAGVAEAKAHPEFAFTLANLLAQHDKALKELFASAIDTLKELVGQSKSDSTRLGAIDRLFKVLEMTQPKGANIFVGVTLEELERRVKEGA